MDPIEAAVRKAADEFLAARKAAEAAGYRVFWQSTNGQESLVVTGGPEVRAAVDESVVEAPKPARGISRAFLPKI